MKTDWENYRQLEAGEVIRYGDEQLSPEAGEDGWDEISASRIGTRASDPQCSGHMRYRRPCQGGHHSASSTPTPS